MEHGKWETNGMGWMRGADGLIERPIHGEKTKAENNEGKEGGWKMGVHSAESIQQILSSQLLYLG
jgi:hypothetical protein